MLEKNASIIEWLQVLASQPYDIMKITITLLLGEVGRWCLAGGKLRERIGDFIICLLIFYLIHPWIPIIPPIAGIKIRSCAVAIIISLLGSHGAGKVLLYFLNKRTGINLDNITKKGR